MFSINAYEDNIRKLKSRHHDVITEFILDTSVNRSWDNNQSALFIINRLSAALNAGGYNASPGITNFSPKGIKSKHRKAKH